MKILVCGATGFVGRHISEALQQAGHTVIRGVRKPIQPNDIGVDFSQDTDKKSWLPRLQGIDVVINAVGVLRSSNTQPMNLLHEQSPLALFSACQEVEVKRIVQISALGVDQGVETPYFQTRRKAEAYLNNLPSSINWLILRPSVIYGEDGASAKMFRLISSLPVHFLPGGGHQKMQPVHIDDICAAISQWLANPSAQSQTVACVGLEATDMRGMLDSYRAQLKHSQAFHIQVPGFFIKATAKLGDFIPSSPLCSDTLKMLNAGNTSDSAEFTRILGKPPRSFKTFI